MRSPRRLRAAQRPSQPPRVAAPRPGGDGHHRGLTRRNGFQSKRQWRWAFAQRKPWARAAAHRSRAYKALPTKKRRSR